MVAKSFESYEVLGSAYEKSNGKQYIKVRNPKTGIEREVRWYSNAEYKKLYPDAFVLEDKRVNHRKILGFGEKGWITIFRDVSEENEGWFNRCSVTRYHTWWGWYIVSDDDIPDDLPADTEPITLYWDSVKADEVQMKSKNEVETVINSLKFPEASISRPVGIIGDKMNIYAKVVRINQMTTQYGKKEVYILKDQESNVYQWTTDAGKLKKNEWSNLKVKIKDHSTINGVITTIIWYCTVED